MALPVFASWNRERNAFALDAVSGGKDQRVDCQVVVDCATAAVGHCRVAVAETDTESKSESGPKTDTHASLAHPTTAQEGGRCE